MRLQFQCASAPTKVGGGSESLRICTCTSCVSTFNEAVWAYGRVLICTLDMVVSEHLFFGCKGHTPEILLYGTSRYVPMGVSTVLFVSVCGLGR